MTPSNDQFPKFYDMHDIPVRKLRPAALPEKLSPSGVWTSFADPKRFGTEAQQITEKEFRDLCSRWTSTNQKGS